MANDFSKNEEIFWDNLLTAFDTNNITARNVGVWRPDMQIAERSAYTIWRPVPYISVATDGLDVSSDYQDLTQLSVPGTVNTIKNVPWKMNAQELNDPVQRDRKADSAGRALSAVINKAIWDNVALTGSLVVTKSTALGGYDDVAECEALMLEQQATGDMEERCMSLNPRDYKNMAADLAGRQDLQARKALDAYERTSLGLVSGFDTYRDQYTRSLQAAAGGGAITVTGDQFYTPVPNNGVALVDNRYMNLTVSATANVAVGDRFTIANVNAVSHQNKESTGRLKTFTVTQVVDGTTLQISPPIVAGANGGNTQPELDYQNVDDEAKNGAAITWLNTTAAPTNIFYNKSSIEIIAGSLAVEEGDMGGVNVMRETTDSGIEIIFAKQGDIDTLEAKYRFTLQFGTVNKNPEMNGILIGGQV